jgi:hypothetical protein
LGAVGSTPSGEVKFTRFGSGCSIWVPWRWLSSLGTVGSGLRRGLRRPGLSLRSVGSRLRLVIRRQGLLLRIVGSRLRLVIRRQGLLLRSSVGSRLRLVIRRQGLSLRGLRSLGVDSGLRGRLKRDPRRVGLLRPRRFSSLSLRLWPSSPLLMGLGCFASGLRPRLRGPGGGSCRRLRFELGLRTPTHSPRRWAGPSLPCLSRVRGASSFRLVGRGGLPLRRVCRDSVVNCRCRFRASHITSLSIPSSRGELVSARKS